MDAAASPLMDHVKQAILESMDYLFDQKISKLIYQIEATSNRMMDHATEDINKIVDNFKAQMEDLVKNAIKNAEEMADHTIEEIKRKIIDEAFEKLKDLENQIFIDITKILNQVDSMLKEVSCFSQAIVKRITDDIKNLLPRLPNPFNPCR